VGRSSQSSRSSRSTSKYVEVVSAMSNVSNLSSIKGLGSVCVPTYNKNGRILFFCFQYKYIRELRRRFFNRIQAEFDLFSHLFVLDEVVLEEVVLVSGVSNWSSNKVLGSVCVPVKRSWIRSRCLAKMFDVPVGVDVKGWSDQNNLNT
jgi:hypothetical protein